MVFGESLYSNITLFIVEPDTELTSTIIEIVDTELPGAITRSASTLTPELSEFDAFIPKILIMDVSSKNSERIQLIAQLLAIYPELKIIILTEQNSVELAVKCMKMGVSDFIVKNSGFEIRLKQALQQISNQINLAAKVSQLRNSVFEADTYPMVIFKASEKGMDVCYQDFNVFPEQIPLQLVDFIQNIGVSILVAIGQGHNYPEGCYSLPAGISSQYSLLVFAFRLPDTEAKDPRLAMGYYQLCLFIPDALSTFLPSLPEMKDIVSLIKEELISSKYITPQRLDKLKEGIIREIQLIKSD